MCTKTVSLRCWKVKIVGKKIKPKKILNTGVVPATVSMEFYLLYISWFASPTENYLYVQISAGNEFTSEKSKLRNASSKFYPLDYQRIRDTVCQRQQVGPNQHLIGTSK